MANIINVGRVDSTIRTILGGFCLGVVGYHFIIRSFIPTYGIILLVILVVYLLKTGFTRSCPVMKAMNVSTVKKEEEPESEEKART